MNQAIYIKHLWHGGTYQPVTCHPLSVSGLVYSKLDQECRSKPTLCAAVVAVTDATGKVVYLILFSAGKSVTVSVSLTLEEIGIVSRV